MSKYQFSNQIYVRLTVTKCVFFMIAILQYGFVNYALELLVVKTFGEETWEEIK